MSLSAPAAPEEPVAVPDELQLTLRAPIEFDGVTHSSLTFREPLAGEIEAIASLPNHKGTITLLAEVAGVPEAVTARLAARDYKKADAFLGLFSREKAKPLTQEQLDALPENLALPLHKPIVFGPQTYTSLTFREPVSGQIEAVELMSDFTSTIELLARSAGVLPDVIRKMAARDFNRASVFVGSFTQDAQPTGKVA